MNYAFSFGFLVTDSDGSVLTDSRLEAVVDTLMEAMVDRETSVAYDSSVGAALSRGEVDVDIEVSADDEPAAAALARDFVGEAIRSTGGVPAGLFVFPPRSSQATPQQEWHERRVELAIA